MLKLKRYYLNENVIISEVAGEMVAVPVVDTVAQMNKVFTLNSTAAFIVELMKEPITIDELTLAIINEFDVDADEAKRDISEIIEKGKELKIFSVK